MSDPKQKHTPGPWKISYESIDPEWAVVTGANGHIVANVNSESGPDIYPMVSTKMPRDANALLIAAAPDMLAALKAILPLFQYLPSNESPEEEMVLNAIAKAEGG